MYKNYISNIINLYNPKKSLNKDYVNRIEEQMPAAAKEIIDILNKNKFKAYLVGGCVRDIILNKIPADWDICTSATPEEMMEIFKDYHTIPTGLKHGTITIVIEGGHYEITTFRVEEGYSDNRKPDKVSFIKDVKQDLARRDFTINAIAYNSDEGFIDPFNGISDIQNEIIRCVGNPKDRFSEDGLRILRALRFAARFGFEIEKETSEAILEKKNLLSNISYERINSELCKILMSDSCRSILSEYREVVEVFLPEFTPSFTLNQNNPHHIYTVWEHTLCSLSSLTNDADVISRLTIFFHDIGKPHCYSEDENGIGHFYGHAKMSAEMTDEILRRLRFSNQIRNSVIELVNYHDISFEPNKKRVKRLIGKMGEEQLRRLIVVKMADMFGQNREHVDWTKNFDRVVVFSEMMEELIREEDCFQLKDLAVNGYDIVSLGIKGKDVGEMLRLLLDMVINEEIENNRKILMNKAREIWEIKKD